MSIQLTQRAATRIQKFLDKDQKAVGLKLDIKKTGCSGWGYNISLPHHIQKDEKVFTDKGIQMIVPSLILDKVDGTVIDFEQQGLNAIFVYKNPKATGECGCGESFTTN